MDKMNKIRLSSKIVIFVDTIAEEILKEYSKKATFIFEKEETLNG